MGATHNQPGLTRRYLLGHLKGLEREQLEKRFVIDPEYREETLIIEEELLEDYLELCLIPDDKRRLDSQYFATPQREQKLLVARAIRRYCLVEEISHCPRRDR